MRLIAIHDSHGTIEALSVGPADAPDARVSTAPGAMVTVIDEPGIRVDLDNPDELQRLTDVLAQYRIQVRSEAKLVKRG